MSIEDQWYYFKIFLRGLKHGETVEIGNSRVCRTYGNNEWQIVDENGDTTTITISE